MGFSVLNFLYSLRKTVAPFPEKPDALLPMSAPRGDIVAFFTTGTFYEQEAVRMARTATRLGLKVFTVPVKNSGSWLANVAVKPTFLLKERQERRGPLLYVDVDAVFHRDPWPALAAYDCDIAVYRENGRIIAATIFLQDTPAAVKLLGLWKERCDRDPDTWDQIHLQNILDEDSRSASPAFREGALPDTFCWVFDRHEDDGAGKVLIEQLQASRQAIREKRLFGRMPKKLRLRQMRVAQIESILAAEAKGAKIT